MKKNHPIALIFTLWTLHSLPALAAPAVLTPESIATHFVGPLAAVAEALDRGETAAARALMVEIPDSAPRRFLRARLLSRSGEDVQAGEAFFALREDFPRLADHWAFEAGAHFSRAGRWERAIRCFDAIPASSRLFDRARLERSAVLEAMGALPEARSALDALSRRRAPSQGEDLGAAALLRQARLSARQGDMAGQRTALVALWREHPRTSLDGEQLRAICADVIADGKAPLAEGCPRLGIEDHLGRAERLVALHYNRGAIAALEPLVARLDFPSPLACRARWAFGEAHRKERLHERAIEIFTPVVEACPAQKEKALYSLASSQSIAHPERDAVFYDRFIEEFPGSPNRAQAEWFAAALEIQNGRIEAASRRLETLARRFPKSRYASEALFKRFWLDWRSGKFVESKTWLDRILRRYPDRAGERQRALYWKARSDERVGRAAAAIAGDEALGREAPVSYYGVMALRQLERADPKRACVVRADIARAVRGVAGETAKVVAPLASPSSSEREDLLALLPLKLGKLGRNPRLAAAIELMRLGIADAAREELSALSREKQSQSDRKALAVLMGLAGDFRGAQWIARLHFASIFDQAPTPETRGLWILAWPRAHRSLLEERCAPHRVDPDLLQALMREESALDPLARSWAGALGLTQLMPERAEEVARLVGRDTFTADELFEPATSIEFGCAWLGVLLREFAGEPLHAFAAYNADSERVRHWLSRPSAEALDHFVEEIPIAETRGYVKRLVRSEAIYRWLYRPVRSLVGACSSPSGLGAGSSVLGEE